ncbi:hypothetical protein MNBD_GAMMA24-2089 [hydrothermal vent metagenome]|uniref:Histidine kinase domain-containing protein n=1 Tax=hydrothermal vent metagenome TaxID=652676 RepID=A0A3B1BBA3_9ZZZZ
MIAYKSREVREGDINEERKQLQERVNLALKFVDEVGNPLTAVDGAIDLLFQCWQEQLAKAEPGKLRKQEITECFRILHEQTERMETLLQSIRRFGILTDRKNDFTDANEIIDTATALVRMEKYEQDVEIVNQLDNSIPAIKLEQSIVVFCLYSALSTITEICAPRGRVVVKSIADKNGVSVSIECQDVDLLQCKKAACLAAKIPDTEKGLTPLENCTRIIRSVIEEHGGHVFIYCVPRHHCGINLVFPATID